MKSNSNQTSGGSKILQFCLAPFVLLAMAIWEPTKYLCRKAYGGSWSRALLVGMVGLVASVFSGVQTFSILGAGLGINGFAAFAGGVLASYLTFGIVWPGLYLVVFKPLWNFGDWLFNKTRTLVKDVIAPLFNGAADVASKLPLAGHLWQVVRGEGENKKQWGLGVFQVIVGIASVAVSAWAGYNTLDWAGTILPRLAGIDIPNVNLTLSWVLAATVFGFCVTPLMQLLDRAKAGYTVAATAAGATYALATFTGLFGGLSGLSYGLAFAGLTVAGFVWGVPLVIAFLQGGLVEAFLRKWGELLEAVYDDEPNKAYRKLFHHSMNLVLTVVAGYIGYVVWQAVSLPAVLVWPAAVVAALYAYVAAFDDVIDRNTGNPMFGVTTAIAAGVGSWWILPGLTGMSHGAAVAWAVGVTAATGLVAYPLAYLVVRALTSWAAAPLGDALAALHAHAIAAFKGLRAQVRRMQKAALADHGDYSNMVGHVFNIAVVGYGVYQAWPLAVGALTTQFGLAAWINAVIVGFVAVNAFMLLGKLFSRWGAETLMCTLSLAGLACGALWAWGVTGNWWQSAVVALTLAGVGGGIVAPALYLAVRPVANLVLTPWLSPLLTKVFDGLWIVYKGFWNMFEGVYRVAYRIIAPIARGVWKLAAPIVVLVWSLVTPLVKMVKATWNSVSEAISGMFGGGRKK
ncbi:MAG: hypothetical protein K2X70_12695 [Candidatus Obscuribacterales bacterium]|nr:hypothetical protein [Candidatus Obscuribacterales bacterium]